MTIEYKITNLERVLPDSTVVTAHWTALLQDGIYSASSYGSVGLSREESAANFIEFEELTEEIVIEWVKALINTEALEVNLAAQIAEQKAPKKASGLPWIQAPTE